MDRKSLWLPPVIWLQKEPAPCPTRAPPQVGTHSELIARGGIYAALVRRQSGKMLEQDRDLAPHERQAAAQQAQHGGEDGGAHDAAGGGAEGGGAGGGGAATSSMDAAAAAGEAAEAAGAGVLVGSAGLNSDQLLQLKNTSRPAGIGSRNSEEPK